MRMSTVQKAILIYGALALVVFAFSAYQCTKAIEKGSELYGQCTQQCKGESPQTFSDCLKKCLLMH